MQRIDEINESLYDTHSGKILGEQRETAVLWAYLCSFWASDGGLGGRGGVVCPSQRQMRCADARG